MRILYFGVYDSEYSRNRVLIRSLDAGGVSVLKCSISPKDKLPLLKLFFKYWKFRNKYDMVMVGFPGQKVMFLAKLLTSRPIIFDAFTSHYGGYILDRKKYSINSPHAFYYRFLDRWSCKLADLVLLDTQAHIDFFVREFGLPREKFRRVFVGTDSSVFYPRQSLPGLENFRIHFHGNFIPLQGVEYIVQAAKLLERENLEFNIIGKGQTYSRVRELAHKLNSKNMNFIDPVPYSKLSDYISHSDVCLGIFGESPKTRLVIPNKIFEAIAMAKPVITADTPAIRELFTDRENIFLCHEANPQNLADAILQLKQDKDLQQKISKGAYEVFKNRASENVIGAELLKIISSLVQ